MNAQNAAFRDNPGEQIRKRVALVLNVTASENAKEKAVREIRDLLLSNCRVNTDFWMEFLRIPSSQQSFGVLAQCLDVTYMACCRDPSLLVPVVPVLCQLLENHPDSRAQQAALLFASQTYTIGIMWILNEGTSLDLALLLWASLGNLQQVVLNMLSNPEVPTGVRLRLYKLVETMIVALCPQSAAEDGSPEWAFHPGFRFPDTEEISSETFLGFAMNLMDGFVGLLMGDVVLPLFEQTAVLGCFFNVLKKRPSSFAKPFPPITDYWRALVKGPDVPGRNRKSVEKFILNGIKSVVRITESETYAADSAEFCRILAERTASKPVQNDENKTRNVKIHWFLPSHAGGATGDKTTANQKEPTRPQGVVDWKVLKSSQDGNAANVVVKSSQDRSAGDIILKSKQNGNAADVLYVTPPPTVPRLAKIPVDEPKPTWTPGRLDPRLNRLKTTVKQEERNVLVGNTNQPMEQKNVSQYAEMLQPRLETLRVADQGDPVTFGGAAFASNIDQPQPSPMLDIPNPEVYVPPAPKLIAFRLQKPAATGNQKVKKMDPVVKPKPPPPPPKKRPGKFVRGQNASFKAQNFGKAFTVGKFGESNSSSSAQSSFGNESTSERPPLLPKDIFPTVMPIDDNRSTQVLTGVASVSVVKQTTSEQGFENNVGDRFSGMNGNVQMNEESGSPERKILMPTPGMSHPEEAPSAPHQPGNWNSVPPPHWNRDGGSSWPRNKNSYFGTHISPPGDWNIQQSSNMYRGDNYRRDGNYPAGGPMRPHKFGTRGDYRNPVHGDRGRNWRDKNDENYRRGSSRDKRNHDDHRPHSSRYEKSHHGSYRDEKRRSGEKSHHRREDKYRDGDRSGRHGSLEDRRKEDRSSKHRSGHHKRPYEREERSDRESKRSRDSDRDREHKKGQEKDLPVYMRVGLPNF